MRRRRGALAVVAATAALVALTQRDAPPLPRDRALAAPSLQGSEPLRLAFLGTSLTALYDWPARLGEELGQCLDRPVTVSVIASPGASASWGRDQAPAIAAARPHIVLVEFAINDADLRDGLSARNSAAAHREIVAALRVATPPPVIAFMTMSPAQGLRGWMRPRLPARYAAYADLASELGTGLVDLYPRWLARSPGERGLERDGLHPDPEVAANVILPVLLPALGALMGRACAG